MKPDRKAAFEKLQKRLKDTFEKAKEDFAAEAGGQPLDYMSFDELGDAEDAIDRRAAQPKPEQK